MKSNHILLVLGLVLCLSVGHAAQVLFSNPADSTNAWSALTSCRGTNGSGYVTLDTFQLSSASRITRISWVGLYWDSVNHSRNPVGPNTTNWRLGFMTDNDGSLGTLVKVYDLPVVAVPLTQLSNIWMNGDPVRLLSFTAELPTPLYLPGDVTYWFYALSEQDQSNPLFASWSGGPGASLQVTLPAGTMVVQARNRAFTLEGEAYSGPIPWANGHTYEVLSAPAGITWTAARDAAAGRGGHLATITSTNENAFVFELVRNDLRLWTNIPPAARLLGPWIGGFQTNGSPEPAGGWQWVTGERFAYTNWAEGQPNNDPANQDSMHFVGPDASTPGSTWNDLGSDWLLTGYVVEYERLVTSIRISQVEISFPTLADGLLYQIQYSHDPGFSTWWDLGQSQCGDGELKRVLDNVPPGEPGRYYRVVRTTTNCGP